MRAIILLALFSPNPLDLEFSIVQERWVGQQDVAYATSHLPPLVLQLGSPVYDYREWAEVYLIHRGERELRPLVWAGLHKDPEIRNRTRRILNQLFICRACEGTGDCPKCRNMEEEYAAYGCTCNWRRECDECRGSGDQRYVMGYVAIDNQSVLVPVPRDYFEVVLDKNRFKTEMKTP